MLTFVKVELVTDNCASGLVTPMPTCCRELILIASVKLYGLTPVLVENIKLCGLLVVSFSLPECICAPIIVWPLAGASSRANCIAVPAVPTPTP